MPKISKRRQPHCHQQAQQATSISAAALSQARKVSFEEGSHSSSSDSLKSCHSTSSSTLIPRTSPCSNMLLMSTLLEPQHETSCQDFDEIPSVSVDQEDSPPSSPWGQFVDVIPSHDDYNDDWSPSCYEPISLHSSPAYHPYDSSSRTTRRHVLPRKSTAGLAPIPNKRSTTRKLQPRRPCTDDVQEAFELLRF